MSFVATAIGAGVAITTAAVSAGVGAGQRKKAEAAQKEMLEQQAEAQLQSSYLSLWGDQTQARGGIYQGGLSLLSAKTNQSTAIYIGISIFSVGVLWVLVVLFRKLINI